MEVRKRNGRIVGYDAEKIVVAVEKAMAETEKGIDSAISRTVAQDVSDRFQGEEIIDIESIQDAVEFSLM